MCCTLRGHLCDSTASCIKIFWVVAEIRGGGGNAVWEAVATTSCRSLYWYFIFYQRQYLAYLCLIYVFDSSFWQHSNWDKVSFYHVTKTLLFCHSENLSYHYVNGIRLICLRS